MTVLGLFSPSGPQSVSAPIPAFTSSPGTNGRPSWPRTPPSLNLSCLSIVPLMPRQDRCACFPSNRPPQRENLPPIIWVRRSCWAGARVLPFPAPPGPAAHHRGRLIGTHRGVQRSSASSSSPGAASPGKNRPASPCRTRAATASPPVVVNLQYVRVLARQFLR